MKFIDYITSNWEVSSEYYKEYIFKCNDIEFITEATIYNIRITLYNKKTGNIDSSTMYFEEDDTIDYLIMILDPMHFQPVIDHMNSIVRKEKIETFLK